MQGESHDICAAKMWDEKLCGRPAYPGPCHDSYAVCIMHSSDPKKSKPEFHAAIEQILANAEAECGKADFSGFKFPSANFSGKRFHVICIFSRAEFQGSATFASTTFECAAHFRKAVFHREVNFSRAKFMGAAVFDDARFEQNSSFVEATFELNAEFERSQFNVGEQLTGGSLNRSARFEGTKFGGEARFRRVLFAGRAVFQRARFTKHASFFQTTFQGPALFHLAAFGHSGSFWETRFLNSFPDEPALQFCLVRIANPEALRFYKTDLTTALFYLTDVSKLDFKIVDWRRRGERLYLFEEVVDLVSENDDLSATGSQDPRNYGLIAEIYQQLKRNYDAKGDYWTAGHFHYGEMEMLRLHSRFRLKPFRWLSRNLSLTALYKYASAYGESMSRPLAWLVAIVVLFSLLFPLAGLEVNPKQGETGLAGWQVDYWNARPFFQQHAGENPTPRWVRWMTRNHAAVPLLVHSGMTALSVAGFQKELRYSPAYPWGRALALLELSLTTTLGGLFLLAIRRQYKRA